MSEHYVNNREFTAAVSAWVRERKIAIEEGKEIPPIPEYVGACFLKIAQRYAMKPNWARCGSHLEDMAADAAISCLKYAHNFNPEKSNNAFSYFTQYCHNSFLQHIKKEKKLTEFKFEMVKENNPQIAKMDYNNIILYDEENAGFTETSEAEDAITEENIQIAEAEELPKDDKI